MASGTSPGRRSGPSSRSVTASVASADKRLARTQPAEPAPTITQCSTGCTMSVGPSDQLIVTGVVTSA